MKNSKNGIKTELKYLNKTEQKHLEKEFENYQKIFPKEANSK